MGYIVNRTLQAPQYVQETQLLQRDCLLLRVTEYFSKFLLAFHGNYGPLLYHFGDKTRYWSKIAIFHTPLDLTSPLGGGFPSEYCNKVWCGKTSDVAIRWRNKFCDMFSHFNTIPTCDRQTDGQTSWDNIVRAVHTHRAVKCNKIIRR